MSDMKISVVVPVYNPPIESLQRCIASIFAQAGPMFEVIFVDDGSVDEIARLLDGVAASHANVRVIHQENRGVSYARNVGTQASCGEYLFYVDCDDEVLAGCFDEGINAAEATGADIVYGYVLRDPAKNGGHECLSSCDGAVVEMSIDKLMMYHLKGSMADPVLVPQKRVLYVKVGPIARFIKRELAISSPFPVDVPVSEDTVWNLSLLLSASSAVVVRSAWYSYWTNMGSAVNRYRRGCAEEAMFAMDALKETMGPAAVDAYLPGFVERGIGELNRIARMYAKTECDLTRCEKRQNLVNAYNSIFSGWGLIDLLQVCRGVSIKAKIILCKTGLSLLVFRMAAAKRSA